MRFKLIFTFLLLPFCCSVALSQKKVESSVDERVEIVSIIFRLAGNPEYNMKFAKNYCNDIHSYFDKYKNDPVINFAKELSEQKNMGFSRVMFLAVHLQFKEGKFFLIKESESNLLGKWDTEDAAKFVVLLNKFYRVSKFNTFFSQHKNTYLQATTQFDRSVTEFDQNWYLDYYGDHEVDYKVVVGLGNGGANYGPSVTPLGQTRLVYAIMGSWTFNEDGKALFPEEEYLPYLIHEFNHSFIDHLLEDKSIEASLTTSGEILLSNRKNEMKLEGYEDWHSVINESLVRASVVRYMIGHGQSNEAVEQEIEKQIKKGFSWTRELVSLLGQYESSRSKYPTFKSFYPQLTSFFDKSANTLK